MTQLEPGEFSSKGPPPSKRGPVPRPGSLLPWMTLALLCASVVAVPLAVGALNRIPNTRAAFDRYRALGSSFVVGGAVTLAAVSAVAWRCSLRALRRAGVAGGAMLLAATVAAIAPVPFGLGVLAGEMLLYVGAALYAAACGRGLLEGFRGGKGPPWAAPLAWLGAVLCVSVALVWAKLSALGWSSAMD